MFTDIKQTMDNPVVHRITAYAAFDGSPEGIKKIVQKYQSNPDLHFYAWVEDEITLGICGYEIHSDKIEVHLISVDEHVRGRKIGSLMITALQEMYKKDVEAETSCGAVEFYRKRGFETTEFMHEIKGKRHTCVLKITGETL